MDILFGLLIWAVFFVVSGSSFYFGYKFGRQAKKSNPVDEETIRKQEQLKQHFDNLMNYDLDTAYGKKVSK